MLENTVGINIIGTLLLLLGGDILCTGPQKGHWQRPHLVPVHFDEVWYSLGTSVNTRGYFF